MKRKLIITLIILLSFVMMIACSNQGEKSTADSHKGNKESRESTHGVSDLREETKDVETLPRFLTEKPDDMQLIYQAAAINQDLLEKIPCYCGCGEEAGHKNNYDCFVFENKKSGAIVWDDHGTKCGVCLEIAAKSVLDYSKGKSIKEIRNTIDETYKQGYAKPTPTPEM
ncbi:PCYCGC motif-containing (lipo)protein [Fictibacillus aquaticus]